MFCSNWDLIGLFSAQVGSKLAREQGWSVTFLDRANHQFTTVWNCEKHTIANHYSAPKCCWQAWARQIRKWKDYNTISLSCTLLLINQCQFKINAFIKNWFDKPCLPLGLETQRMLRKMYPLQLMWRCQSVLNKTIWRTQNHTKNGK